MFQELNIVLITENLSKSEVQRSTKFKFGDGRQVTVIKCNVFPAVIAGKHCKINAEIVKENILLLLSK